MAVSWAVSLAAKTASPRAAMWAHPRVDSLADQTADPMAGKSDYLQAARWAEKLALPVAAPMAVRWV